MSNHVLGSIRLVKKENNRTYIEVSDDLTDEMQFVLAGMLIEVLANKHNTSVDDMTEILVGSINKAPMSFKEMEP